MGRVDDLELDLPTGALIAGDAATVFADARPLVEGLPAGRFPARLQGAGLEVGTFAEYGLEQTRPFRALKTWATVAARGRDGIVEQVTRANALARELAGLVEHERTLELACPPQTSIVAFRAQPDRCSAEQVEAVNRALPEAVQARGRAFVTGTVYDGRETLRACILHPGTNESDLATLVTEVVSAAAELAATAR